MEKCGKSKQWYFYVQMEGSETECEKFECQVTLSPRRALGSPLPGLRL
jgi:hypothetical protein